IEDLRRAVGVQAATLVARRGRSGASSVTADGHVVESNTAEIVDTATVVPGVVMAESGLKHRQRASIPQAAAIVGRRVAVQGRVNDRPRSIAPQAAAIVAARVVRNDAGLNMVVAGSVETARVETGRVATDA